MKWKDAYAHVCFDIKMMVVLLVPVKQGNRGVPSRNELKYRFKLQNQSVEEMTEKSLLKWTGNLNSANYGCI